MSKKNQRQKKCEILLMEELLHQLICSLTHYLQGFIHPRWCRISSINSIPMASTLMVYIQERQAKKQEKHHVHSLCLMSLVYLLLQLFNAKPGVYIYIYIIG